MKSKKPLTLSFEQRFDPQEAIVNTLFCAGTVHVFHLLKSAGSVGIGVFDDIWLS